MEHSKETYWVPPRLHEYSSGFTKRNHRFRSPKIGARESIDSTMAKQEPIRTRLRHIDRAGEIFFEDIQNHHSENTAWQSLRYLSSIFVVFYSYNTITSGQTPVCVSLSTYPPRKKCASKFGVVLPKYPGIMKDHSSARLPEDALEVERDRLDSLHMNRLMSVHQLELDVLVEYRRDLVGIELFHRPNHLSAHGFGTSCLRVDILALLRLVPSRHRPTGLCSHSYRVECFKSHQSTRSYRLELRTRYLGKYIRNRY
ncbi:hypothetical protein MBM_02884 [Drepanopeziza brunnea f. sp. 'multigermtubi' MB_m1]|uniref:Uncharacterized protein n=1 Tax=Marssonina brunnea f. sp. multigermtubi (strain MB_m1) TaxID=1072389 RepID=K1X113_MARBU|nr:uncharacterized protein MBM_02884 [Drepanopeziza brunnea f. sp. 'multigermtubi' MB_m1]EKD18642.1 hypothetical protein MBM_02884 [Drepanopeziza brunnea f. sp. 'multigermtubi' MB_m1]